MQMGLIYFLCLILDQPRNCDVFGPDVTTLRKRATGPRRVAVWTRMALIIGSNGGIMRSDYVSMDLGCL